MAATSEPIALNTGELSVANGRVYLGTFDNILYSFGIDASVKK